MARRSFTYELNHSAIKAIPEMPSIKAIVAQIAKRGATETRRIAPRGPTGQYAGSIVSGSDSYGSTDSAAHIVEFGSVNNAPYRPLHRAAQAMGLKVEDT